MSLTAGYFLFFQTFLSELYVYLIDEMHESLTKTLALEDQAPVPKPLTDSAQLKHFAREAEVNGNFELATKYYQEVRRFILLPEIPMFQFIHCKNVKLSW